MAGAARRRPEGCESLCAELRWLSKEELAAFVPDLWIEIGREIAVEMEEEAAAAAEVAAALQAAEAARIADENWFPPAPPPGRIPGPAARDLST